MGLRFTGDRQVEFVNDDGTDPRMVLLALGITALEIRGNLAPSLSREMVAGCGAEIEMVAEDAGRDTRVRMAVLPFQEKVEAAEKYLETDNYPRKAFGGITYYLSMDYAHVPWPVYVKLHCRKLVNGDALGPFLLHSYQWSTGSLHELLRRAEALLASGLLKNIDPASLAPVRYRVTND